MTALSGSDVFLTRKPVRMNRPICYVDIETTGLSARDYIWELSVLRVEGTDTPNPERYDEAYTTFVKHDVAKAEFFPDSFRADHDARYDPERAVGIEQVVRETQRLMVGCHVVGAVPNFDTEQIAAVLLKLGLQRSWHYHLIDVETLIVGYMAAAIYQVPALPWDSDALSRWMNIEPPPTGVRHTSLGDVIWAKDLFEQVVPVRCAVEDCRCKGQHTGHAHSPVTQLWRPPA